MIASFFPTIASKKDIADNTIEVTFDMSESDLSFAAGQYVTIILPNAESRPITDQFHDFSVESSPNNRGSLRIAFRGSDSFFKTTLMGMPLGSRIKLEGPRGIFTLPESSKEPLVFIAGGIGIIPFMSLIASVIEEKLDYEITMLYSNRTLAATAYYQELLEFAKKYKHLKLVFTMTDDANWKGEKSPINVAFIKDHIANFEGSRYFIAGPPYMASAVRDELTQAGIEDNKIIVESFTGEK